MAQPGAGPQSRTPRPWSAVELENRAFPLFSAHFASKSRILVCGKLKRHCHSTNRPLIEALEPTTNFFYSPLPPTARRLAGAAPSAAATPSETGGMLPTNQYQVLAS